MAGTRRLVVEVLADAKGLTREFGKISGQTDSIGRKFATFGKTVGVGLGAGAAAVGAFGVMSFKAAEEAAKQQRTVAAIIKATGGAANVTAKQIGEFANQQQFLVGVDDEVLKRSYGMLLAFRNVRNETGAGNRIFDRAAKSLADLSAAGFGSTDTAAKQLGRALQDPIKYMGSLARAGVTFTQGQKDQAAALVRSGDLLGAQKLILAEVESRVGGTAKASMTASQRITLAFGEVQETVGAALLPIMERLSVFVTDRLIPGLTRLWRDNAPKIRDAFEKIRERVEPIVRELGARLAPVITRLGEIMKKNKPAIVAFIAAIAGAAAIAGIVALVAAIASLFNPITLIVLAIGAVAAAFVAAYKNSDAFRERVDGVVAFFRERFPVIKEAVLNVLGFIVDYYTRVFDGIRLLWSVFGDDLIRAFRGIWDVLKGIFDFFISLLAGRWSDALGGLVTAVKGIGGILAGAFGAVFEIVRAVVVGVFDGIWAAIRGIINLIIGGWESVANAVVRGVNVLVRGFNNIPVLPDIPELSRVTLPRLADGGIVEGRRGVGVPLIAGEAGPEAIVPLNRNGSGIGATVNINVTATPMASPADIGAAVVDALKAYERRNGALPLRVA